MKLIRENLDGKHVALELICENHREGLREAANDPDLWIHATKAGDAGAYNNWFDDALHNDETGRDITYIVRDKATDSLVGSTRFTSIVAEHKRLEIGYTWYSQRVWGGVVNPSCKALLFGHAFERMKANRVELKANSLNLHSKAAMKKMGATFEGTLRNHMVNPDGKTLRHSIVFSVIKNEWPQVKAGLLVRL